MTIKIVPKISHQGIVLVIVPLALNLVVLSCLAQLLAQQERQTEQEARAKQFELLSNSFGRTFFDAGIAMYTSAMRRDKTIANRFERLEQGAEEIYAQLRDMEQHNSEQQGRLRHLRMIETRVFKLFDGACQAILQGRDAQLLLHQSYIKDELQALVRNFMSEMEELNSHEHIGESSGKFNGIAWGTSLKYLIAVSIFVTVAVSLALSLYFGRNIASRLRHLMANTARLAAGDKLPPILPGEDEIAVLDRVYHEMAASLAASRHRQKALIDNTAAAICTIDGRGKLLSVNPACQQIWGYSTAELAQANIAALVAAKQPLPLLSEDNMHDGKERELVFEATIKHKDGRNVDMLWSVYWSAQEQIYLCIAHDISARKAAEAGLRESEAKVRAIISSMPIGLFILDSAGLIESVNGKAEELFGDGSQLVGQTFTKLIASDALHLEYTQPAEISIERVNRPPLRAQLSLTTFSHNGARKLLAIVVDITERYQLEQARVELLNIVSHDMRTPLTSMHATLALLQADAQCQMSDHDRQQISFCQDELQKLLSLINGLLDLERVRHGALEINRQVNSLRQLTSQALNATSGCAAEKSVTLINETVDCDLLCDGPRMVHVTMQYLLALLACSNPGDEIKVTGGETPDNQVMVSISLAEHSRHRSPLKQIAASPDVSASICASIVTAHGGTTGSASRENATTYYWYRLPLPAEA